MEEQEADFANHTITKPNSPSLGIRKGNGCPSLPSFSNEMMTSTLQPSGAGGATVEGM